MKKEEAEAETEMETEYEKRQDKNRDKVINSKTKEGKRREKKARTGRDRHHTLT